MQSDSVSGIIIKSSRLRESERKRERERKEARTEIQLSANLIFNYVKKLAEQSGVRVNDMATSVGRYHKRPCILHSRLSVRFRSKVRKPLLAAMFEQHSVHRRTTVDNSSTYINSKAISFFLFLGLYDRSNKVLLSHLQRQILPSKTQ